MVRARDAGLAEAAGERAEIIRLLDVGVHRDVGVLLAFCFVMAGVADGFDRASGHALATGAMGIKKAVGVTIRVRARAWGDGHPRDHRTSPHGFSDRGDQSVAQPEGAEPGRICRMPFRPVGARGVGSLARFAPEWRQHRGHCLDAGLGKRCNDMPTQRFVEVFTMMSDVNPSPGRPFCLGCLIVAGVRGGREHPTDHRQRARRNGRRFRKRLVKNVDGP